MNRFVIEEEDLLILDKQVRLIQSRQKISNEHSPVTNCWATCSNTCSGACGGTCQGGCTNKCGSNCEGGCSYKCGTFI